MNPPLQASESQSPALSCWLQAWVVAWAVVTGLSAIVEALFQGLVGPYQVFQIADAVPPLAKITLGMLAAILFYVVRVRGILSAALAGAAAFAGAIVLPVEYFAAGTLSPLKTSIHLFAGAMGGVVFSFLQDRCNARKAGLT